MASALRVNDLLTDSRLDQIEDQIRREFPRLPEGTIFNSYIQPEGYAERNGLDIPIPPVAVMALLVPNPRWPELQPQYKAIKAMRWLHHFRAYENQRDRLVQAPDVPLNDFRAAAKKAIETHDYYGSLLN